MSNQAFELDQQMQELQLQDNNAIDPLCKFNRIRHALQQLGYARDNYSLVQEFIKKFAQKQEFWQATHYSHRDTYEGMQETFIATQKKIEEELKARHDPKAEMAFTTKLTRSLKME